MNTRALRPKFVIKSKYAAPTSAVSLSSDNELLGVADKLGRIHIWELQTGQRIHALETDITNITSLIIFPQTTSVLLLQKNGTLSFWDFKKNKQLSSQTLLGKKIKRITTTTANGFTTINHDGVLSTFTITSDNTSTRIGKSTDNIATAIAPPLNFTLDNHNIQYRPENSDKEYVFTGHSAPVNDVAINSSATFLVSASDDRTVRLWNIQSQKELARLVGMQDGWAVVSPEGFFDGTLDGDLEDRLDALRWEVADRSFGMDGFLESYYSPALLGRIWTNKEQPSQQNLPEIAEGFKLPPTTTISKPIATSDPKKLTINVTATDQGGGISETRLYHNGKRINTVPEVTAKDQAKIHVFTVEAVDGQNDFTAVSLSDHKIEGESVSAPPMQKALPSPTKPDLHVVSIGINQYKNPYLDLDYAVPDAKGVSDYFGANHDLFNKVHRYELYNRKATQTRIQTTLDLLSTVPARDTIIIFLSGHGETLGQEWNFIPYDLTNPSDHNELARKSVSASTLQLLVAKISAHRIFLLIDSCKSGALLDVFAEFDMQQNFAIIARSTGIHIGASTTKEQLAGELATLGHGVFTFALLNGLEGHADNKPQNGTVSVSELLNFIKHKMTKLIEENNIPPQRPTTNSRGADFAITANRPL